MNILESIRLIQASKPIFGNVFYKRLFDHHPDIREHFRDTTIEHQAAILTMQLSVIESFYVNQSQAGKLYLQLLGTKHLDRGIPEEAYPKFQDELLASIQEFHGQDWSEDLAGQWNDAVEQAIREMLKGYDERVRV